MKHVRKQVMAAAAAITLVSAAVSAVTVPVATNASWSVDYFAQTAAQVTANAALTPGSVGLPTLTDFSGGVTPEAVLEYSAGNPAAAIGGSWANADTFGVGSALGTARWIGRNHNGGSAATTNTATAARANEVGYYLFEYTVPVIATPVGQTLSALAIDLDFSSDNRTVNIFVNGTKLTHGVQWNQSGGIEVTYNAITGFAGGNASGQPIVISFIVENNQPLITQGNPVGLLALGTVEASFAPIIPLPASVWGGLALMGLVAGQRIRRAN